MRALVTGATGFIGSHLARRLAREGWAVTGTGRDLSKVPDLEADGVRLVRADLLRTERMAELAAGAGEESPDVVFHSGAWLGGDPSKAEAVNVDATGALVEAAARAGVRRFVHLSSVSVYGLPDDGAVVTEDHPLVTRRPGRDPVSTYAFTKALGDVRAREVAREAGIECVVVRPAMVWGPGSRGWTLRVARAVCSGRPTLVGRGAGHFHGVHVDDLVDALLLAAERPEAAEGGAPGAVGVFNAADEPLTWREYAEAYGRLCGREPKALPDWIARGLALLSRVPGVDPPVDRVRYAMATRRHVYSAARLRERLGWTPRVDVEEGVRRAAPWLRERGVLGAAAG